MFCIGFPVKNMIEARILSKQFYKSDVQPVNSGLMVIDLTNRYQSETEAEIILPVISGHIGVSGKVVMH